MLHLACSTSEVRSRSRRASSSGLEKRAGRCSISLFRLIMGAYVLDAGGGRGSCCNNYLTTRFCVSHVVLHSHLSRDEAAAKVGHPAISSRFCARSSGSGMLRPMLLFGPFKHLSALAPRILGRDFWAGRSTAWTSSADFLREGDCRWFHTEPSAILGAVFLTQAFGEAIVFGVLADRYGRKPILTPRMVLGFSVIELRAPLHPRSTRCCCCARCLALPMAIFWV